MNQQGLWADWLPPGDPPPVNMPSLVPIFGCKSFTTKTTCQDIHRGEIPSHSYLYCPICHQTGSDAQERIDRGPLRPPTEPTEPAILEQWPDPKRPNPTVYTPGKRKGGRA